MKPAWRGFVFDGEVWAWPTLLMTHNQAMAQMPMLTNYDARWRQWEPGGPIDWDPGVSSEDRWLVEAWLEAVSQ